MIESETNEKVRDLLFRQVDKPKGMFDARVINVFDNRYRINLWAKVEEDGLTKSKIAASYFAVLNGDELKIRET